MSTTRTIVFSIVALFFASCQADLKVSDYIYWKKADINKWNQFFPTRCLEQESLTIKAAKLSVPSNISEDLKKILTFQYNEQQIAQDLMAGTPAESCVNGLTDFLSKSIDEEQDEYSDCIADVQSKLTRLSNNLVKINSTYQSSYQRAIAGIDTCAKTYPNKESIDRLRSCIESVTGNYISAANNTQKSVFPSPAMSYFQTIVVGCASTAAQNVAAKGSEFLDNLVHCAAMSKTVDPVAYKEELSQWKGYKDTLANQIAVAQSINYNQVAIVEEQMVTYYNLQKQALEQYVIESRGVDFYLKKIYALLCDYYNTVTAASLDNPGDSQCADAARSALDAAANAGAAESLTCDQTIVADTQLRMSEIFTNFVYDNGNITSIGNVALLDCFAQGYIYAPNTIYDCFTLTAAGFNMDHTSRIITNLMDVQVIRDYMSNFYSNDKLPCGVQSLQKVFLAADKALYELQRCLYKSSGTTYQVTTPVTETTTTPYPTTTPYYTTVPQYS